jgi:hypothetical protein
MLPEINPLNESPKAVPIALAAELLDWKGLQEF